MAKFSSAKTSFIAGELSPNAHALTDLPQYARGAKRIENMTCLKTGALRRRPGSQKMLSVTGSSNTAAIPFLAKHPREASSDIMLAFSTKVEAAIPGAHLIQKDGSVVVAEYRNRSGFTTSLAESMDWCRVNDLTLFAIPDDIPFWADGANLFGLGYDTSDTSLGNTILQDAQPYDTNTTSQTVTLSAATVGTGRTATFSALPVLPYHGLVVDTIPGDSPDVGTWLRVEAGLMFVTAVPSNSTLTVTIVTAASGVGAWTDWGYSKWRRQKGYPRTVAFFDERIWFGGNEGYPNYVWASKVADYDNFRIPASPAATDPLEFILEGGIETVKWMSAKDRLLVGTEDSEHSFEIDGTGYSRKLRSSTGSSRVRPIAVADSVLFVDSSGTQVREIFYEENSQGYQTEDLNTLADHIVGYSSPSGAQIAQMAWQASENTLWILDDNGGVASLNRNKRQQTAGWQRHEIAGTSVIVTAIETMRDDNGNDDVWIACTRVAGGTTYYTVEVMRKAWQKTDLGSSLAADRAQYSCVYLDGAVTSAGTGTVSSVSGLAHLNGETVTIFSDGYYAGTATVSGGSVTLPASATVVVVGMPYTSVVETLDIDAGSQLGSSIGSVKQIDRVTVVFNKTCAAEIGPDDDNLQEISFRNAGDALDDPLTPFSGKKTIDFKGSNDREAQVVISTDSPYPMTVCGLFMRGQTNEG